MARPNLSYLKNVILCLVGLPCGLLSGLTGIGASVLVTPLTRKLLSIGPGPRAATGLAATFACALGATLPYSQTGNVHWGLVIPLVLGQIFGAAMAQGAALQWAAQARARFVNPAIILVVGILLVAFAPGVAAISGGREWPLLLAMIVAIVAGIIAGFLGRIVGLGVFVVPAEMLMLHLKPLEAQGTAIVALIFASLPGMLIYRKTGAFDAQSATWIAFGGLFGALVGGYTAVHHISAFAQVTAYGALASLIGAFWIQGELGRRGDGDTAK
ncbi:MAG: sulfite exporter TauE/SafE family protein [Capsulimonas sp.]|uniref:sulfite exporter TauE/SafE family protein n=1 Tax=Capsulimonas sp. TaxID=2494211 RepID=UPI00326398C7